MPRPGIFDVLGKLPDDELTATVEKGRLTFDGRGKKSWWNTEADIILPVANVETPTVWLPLHKDFCEAINTVAPCAAGAKYSFELTCVHLAPKWVEAGDNYQCCRWRLKTGLEESTLVRADSVKHVASLGMSEFAVTPSWMHFRNEKQVTLSCRRYLETYPDRTAYLDVTGQPVTLGKGLADACTRAGVFSSENGDLDFVRVVLKPGKIKVVGEGVSGGHEERRKCAYDGPDLDFLISPKLLAKIVTEHPDVQVAAGTLKVSGAKWAFVAALGAPDTNKEPVAAMEEDE